MLGFHTTHHSAKWGPGAASLATIVDAAIAAGFDAIGVDVVSVDDASTVARSPLAVTDVLSLRLTGDGGDAARAASIAELAVAVGAPTVIVAVPEPVPTACLLACADVLDAAGVRLGLEPVPYFAVRTLAQARSLCAVVGWERAGLVLDALHLARSGATPDDVATLAAGEVALVQLADAPAVPSPSGLVVESRHERLLPGEGELPLVELVAALRSIGYAGPYVAEVLSSRVRAMGPALAAPLIHRALSAVLGSVPTSGGGP